MIYGEYDGSIAPPDAEAIKAALRRWDSIAKPLHSLGLLEDAIVRIAGIERTANVSIRPRAVVVMCADNGVVAEGVTQTGQEVTAIVARSMARGESSVCRMAKLAGAEVIPVDIGCATELRDENIVRRSIMRGTRNMTEGPAMTRDEAKRAIEAGISVATELAEKGVRLIALGEMGIGNTTTSSAVTSVLTGTPVNEVTGRGAGLDDAGLMRKRDAITRAIALNRPDPLDALDVVSKVGGLDIAGLAGVIIGGARAHVPVLLDGFISLASALTAAGLAPRTLDYIVASHMSDEPASKMVMRKLGLSPMITANMRLGEGTGAVAAMPLLDMALAVYCGMSTFEEIDVPAYKKLC